MEKHHFKNILMGLLTIVLLAGPAETVFAQRNKLQSQRRSDSKPVSRTIVKEKKHIKSKSNTSARKGVRKNSTKHEKSYTKKKTNKSNKNYSKNDNHSRKKDYRDSRKTRKSYTRDKNHAYKHNRPNRHYSNKKTWYRDHYRKPSWVDYRPHRYHYPRIGLHVSALPHGYISFRIGKLRFYSYHGVYYRYDPVMRVYVVINKPRIETWYTSTQWDRITLMDGSTIEGVYRYGDNEKVLFEVGDAMLEIPMSEIKVLTFSE